MTDEEFLSQKGHGRMRLPDYEGEPQEDRWEPAPQPKEEQMTISGSISWWNFRTEEYDQPGETLEDFSDYIPQSSAAQNLYNLLVKHKGKSPLEAALNVLIAATGRK